MTKLPARAALALASAFAIAVAAPARAADVGEVLENIDLRDGSDQPTRIPDLGVKVLAVFYTDADEADMNDPLADALKARKFDERVYRGMGIANLADSKAPNFIIRKIIRGKIEKYKSTILTDPGRRLPKAWKLGDCNNTSVFLLIDRTGKLVHQQRGPIRGDDVAKIVELSAKLVAEAMPAAPAAPSPAAPAAQP